MNDRYPEGVILCHTHGRPFGECRHPQLAGEVADVSKPVTQQQRLPNAHMRSFVEREPINADPHERGVGQGGVDTAWTGRPDPVRVAQGRLRDARAALVATLVARVPSLAVEELEDHAFDALQAMMDMQRPEGIYATMQAVLDAEQQGRLIADIQRGLDDLYVPPVVIDISSSCPHCEENARSVLASMRESVSILGGDVVIDTFIMPKPTLRGRLRLWWLDRVIYPLDDLCERLSERLDGWPYGSILTQVTAAWYSREAASLPYAETYDVWWEGGPIARVWAPALHEALHLTHPLEAGDAFTFNGRRLRVLAIYETHYAYRVVPSWLYHPARAFLGLGRLNERAKRLAYRAGLLHPRVNEELRWSQFRRPEER